MTASRIACCFVLAAASACLQPEVFPCDTDLECLVDGVQGSCHSSGFCAYPDGRCPSEQRFGPAAGGGRALQCVPTDTIGEAGTGDSEAMSSESNGASGNATSIGASTAAEGCNGCDTPENDCFDPIGTCTETGCVYDAKPMGTACTMDDPCVLAAQCDGAGECVVMDMLECNDAPGPCFASPGECQPDGTCGYDMMQAGSDCDDGDDCTEGEACDAMGQCVGGELCPDDDPCNDFACMAGTCVPSAVDDGTSCGGNEADRCCNGTCVDISSDEANCGGCGLQCDSDDTCESVAATNTCEVAPANTSGRCTCDGANADCPHSQVCRTVSPFVNRCTPNDAGGCVNSFQDVNLCPNYCFYP